MKEPKDPLRELAKQNEWQLLYSRAKELNLRLFDNDKDFTRIQLLFMSYLEQYNGLYIDLQLEEDHLNEEVIKSQIRTDAYLTYRRKVKGKDKEKGKRIKLPNEQKGKISLREHLLRNSKKRR